MFFFFNDTATTEIYTLSLHDALPIFAGSPEDFFISDSLVPSDAVDGALVGAMKSIHPADRVLVSLNKRSEEHTSELQSPDHLVCRLLLEKKKIPHLLKTLPPMYSTPPVYRLKPRFLLVLMIDRQLMISPSPLGSW